MRPTTTVCALLGSAFLGAPVHAVMVSYHLDQSNALVDGPNYLRVDLEDVGEDIRLTVTLLEPLLSIEDTASGGAFGLQNFGFNVAGTGTLNPNTNIVGLPTGWSAQLNRNLDGFGRFEVVSGSTGQNRQSPVLSFFIAGVAGDTPMSYVALSSGGDSQFFAAHVAGFIDQDPGEGKLTSAFFAGSAAVVPLPAAVWLLLAGLGGLAGWSRRR